VKEGGCRRPLFWIECQEILEDRDNGPISSAELLMIVNGFGLLRGSSGQLAEVGTVDCQMLSLALRLLPNYAKDDSELVVVGYFNSRFALTLIASSAADWA